MALVAQSLPSMVPFVPGTWTESVGGVYTYPVPAGMAPGRSVDVILLGAGCGGGSVYGGLAGSYSVTTLVCGTDFPIGATGFGVVVGAGAPYGDTLPGGDSTLAYHNLVGTLITLGVGTGGPGLNEYTADGLGPGDEIFNTITYPGGGTVTAYTTYGSAPGGAGAAPGGGSADGAVWCRAY
jgi:hypothetical protein